MRAVILDGGTTNPGDLSWKALEDLAEIEVYDETPQELAVERSKGAEAIIINRIRVNEELLLKLPELKYIGTFSTGINNIDIDAVHRHGIVLSNVPDYCTESVAQHTFALLLEIKNHVGLISSETTASWKSAVEMSRSRFGISELYGKKLGIVGYGNIGENVARIGKAFGMDILVYTFTGKEIPEQYKPVSLSELLTEADVVSLHCALTDSTYHMIGKNEFDLMKKDAVLINTARGGLVNGKELYEALCEKSIAGAAVDVMEEEPPKQEDPLLTMANCIITPHIAWSAPEARKRLIWEVARNLKNYMDGKPSNTI
jgi:glycerate dehydrogenase